MNNYDLIEEIVTSALNSQFDILKTLAIDDEFIDNITTAAKSWAIECYTNDYEYH
jgi:hypothetical protein